MDSRIAPRLYWSDNNPKSNALNLFGTSYAITTKIVNYFVTKIYSPILPIALKRQNT
jgi:hypothetical protein